jgi:Cu/Ag efflux protein CusF
MILAGGVPVGCDRDDEGHGSAEPAMASSTTRPDGTYEVRGVVKALPGRGGGTLAIQHEAIPTFVNIAGKKVGMMAMTMPFAVATGVSLKGISPGDKISFTYEVRFHGEPRNLVTRVAKLPADTELKLGR